MATSTESSTVVSPEKTTGDIGTGGTACEREQFPPPIVPAILPSYIVTKEKFEETSGLPLNEKILQLSPQGNRIIVMVNPPPDEFGGLVLPDEWKSGEKSGSGWVVAVGPTVGLNVPHPNGPLTDMAPWLLLYKQVIFGSYAGKIIRVDFYDRQTKSPFIMLTDRDIWAIDYTPTEYTLPTD